MEAVARLSRRLSDGREEHAVAWSVFFVVVGVLLAFDVTCLQTPLSAGRMSFHTAVKLSTFWLATGVLFDIFILGYMGVDASLGFTQGFFLEYMLSVDNLFVFHLVFAYYCTPEALLYRALYFGIFGAIVLRVVFIFVGGAIVSSDWYIFKFVLGSILIWSAIRSVSDPDDEDTADPTNNRCIAWVTKNLPVSDNYEPHGHFFITVAEVECHPPRAVSGDWADTESNMPEVGMRSGSVDSTGTSGLPRLESFEGSSLLDPHRSGAGGGASARMGQSPEARAEWLTRTASNSIEVTRKPARLRRKASLLLLVVIAVWVVDLVFAVDSVASKLASVNDVFLNCSSSAFAMLSLRSMYFVMDSLTRTFQPLKYGIAVILMLMGLKFIFAKWVIVSNSVCFAIIMAICIGSVVSSYWWPRFRDSCQRLDFGAAVPITEAGEEDDEDEEGLGDVGEDEERKFFDRRARPEDFPGTRLVGDRVVPLMDADNLDSSYGDFGPPQRRVASLSVPAPAPGAPLVLPEVPAQASPRYSPGGPLEDKTEGLGLPEGAVADDNTPLLWPSGSGPHSTGGAFSTGAFVDGNMPLPWPSVSGIDSAGGAPSAGVDLSDDTVGGSTSLGGGLGIAAAPSALLPPEEDDPLEGRPNLGPD